MREQIETVRGVRDDEDSRVPLRTRLQQLVIGMSGPCVLDGEELATVVNIWMRCSRIDPGEKITADMVLSLLPEAWKRGGDGTMLMGADRLRRERVFPMDTCLRTCHARSDTALLQKDGEGHTWTHMHIYIPHALIKLHRHRFMAAPRYCKARLAACRHRVLSIYGIMKNRRERGYSLWCRNT
jgi:hypothetical protein